jgi:hypothetical protein
MWGFRNKNNRQLASILFDKMSCKNISRIYNADRQNKKQGDQNFLLNHFWEIAKKNTTLHASFFCNSFGLKAEPFPTKRHEKLCYVSCIDCCDEIYTNKSFKYKCPLECRPPEHKNWNYC